MFKDKQSLKLFKHEARNKLELSAPSFLARTYANESTPLKFPNSFGLVKYWLRLFVFF